MTPIWKVTLRSLAVFALLAAHPDSTTFAQSTGGKSSDQIRAAKSKGSRAIDISSDTMELHKEENRAVFIGKVDAVRDGVVLYSDKLVADYIEVPQANGGNKTEVRFLNATGNVVVVTETQHITSEWATMDVQKDTAVMGGNVVVKEGKTILRGPKLFLDLDTGQSNMQGGRVRGQFFPQE